jgi:hypothetical protein
MQLSHFCLSFWVLILASTGIFFFFRDRVSLYSPGWLGYWFCCLSLLHAEITGMDHDVQHPHQWILNEAIITVVFYIYSFQYFPSTHTFFCLKSPWQDLLMCHWENLGFEVNHIFLFLLKNIVHSIPRRSKFSFSSFFSSHHSVLYIAHF